MIHRASDLGNRRAGDLYSTRLFADELRADNGLAEMLKNGWRISDDVDSAGVEHIRIGKQPAAIEDDLWEIRSFDEEEAPLELLFGEEDSATEKG